MKKLISFLLLSIVYVNGYCNHYYASTSSGGSNSGTLSNPYTSISAVNSAMSSFNGGDTISFKKGDNFSGRLNITKAGSVGNFIVFNTYGSGAKPIFQNTGTECIKVLGTITHNGYIVIDGFNITDLTFDVNDKINHAPCEQGIRIGEFYDFLKTNVYVRNCDFSNIGGGVVINGDHCLIEYCNFSNMKNVVNTLGTDANHDGTISQDEPGADNDYGGNPITMTGDNNTIQYNYISGGWAESYDYGWNGGAIEIFGQNDSNRVMYNTIIDCGGVSEYGSSGTPFATSATHNLFAYNKIINCGNLSWVNFSGNFSIDANDIEYVNNVVIENSNSRFSGPNTGMGAVTPYVIARIFPETSLLNFSSGSPAKQIYVIKNNIFNLQTGEKILASTTVAGKTTHSNNLFSNNAAIGYTPNGSEISTTAAIFQNTFSADPGDWDLHLISGSPARGIGVVIAELTQDFYGLTLTGARNAGIDNSTGIAVPTKYYVSSSNAGSLNQGTFAQPWKSLADINQSILVAGDSILFKKGDQFSGSMIFTQGGSVGSPITYATYGTGANPLFIGTGSTISSLFYFNGPDYVTLTGLDVTDPTLNASDATRSQLAKIQTVCTVEASSNHIINDHMNVSLVGIGLYTVGDFNTMSYCNYSNMRMVVSDVGGTNDYGANPVTLTSSNNIIDHCVFSDFWAKSNDFTADGIAVKIVKPTGTLVNNIIRYCFIDEGVSASTISANTSGFSWRYNIIVNNGGFLNFQTGFTHGSTDVTNNVFVLTKTARNGNNRLLYGDQVGMTFTNNAFYMRGNCNIATISTGVTHTFNYYNIGAGSSVGWTPTASEKTNNTTQLWGNMVSADPVNWTYTPNDGTTLSFGSNVGISPDYYGNNVTVPVFMGVSQYGSSELIPPTRISSMRRFFKYIINKP